LRYIQQQHAQQKTNGNGDAQVIADAVAVVDQHLRALQLKQHKEIGKAIGRPIEAVQQALDFIRTLDPRARAALQQIHHPPDRTRCRLHQARRTSGSA